MIFYTDDESEGGCAHNFLGDGACDECYGPDSEIIARVGWATELADYGYEEDEILEIMGFAEENDDDEQGDDRGRDSSAADWCGPIC